MPINNDIVLNVKAQYQNSGMDQLKAALKDATRELDNMKQSGQRGTQAWDDQKSRILGLTTSIKELSREYKGLDANTKMSNLTLLEMGENLTIVVNGFRQAISGIKQTATEYLNAAKDMQSATLGLDSVAKFKGIDPQLATDSLKNLDLVKNGLLSLGDASLALKNLLASGFSLPQAIELIKRFGDAAAFGRQSSLTFGYAITSATEGIKNQNSILVDNAGVTKNISVIMKEGGMSMNDLSDATKRSAAIQVLYNGLLRETQGQLGDAQKLTQTFAGEQSKLDAQLLQVKQNFGLVLMQGLKPFMSVLTSMPPALQAATVGIGAIGKAAFDLIPTLSMLSLKFPELTSSIATWAGKSLSWFGIVGIGLINLGVHVDNAIKGFESLSKWYDLVSGKKSLKEIAKDSWADKNIWHLNDYEDGKKNDPTITETIIKNATTEQSKIYSEYQQKMKGLFSKNLSKMTLDDLGKVNKELKDRLNTLTPNTAEWQRTADAINKVTGREKELNKVFEDGNKKKTNYNKQETDQFNESMNNYKIKIELAELENKNNAEYRELIKKIYEDKLESLKIDYENLTVAKNKLANLKAQQEIEEKLMQMMGGKQATAKRNDPFNLEVDALQRRNVRAGTITEKAEQANKFNITNLMDQISEVFGRIKDVFSNLADTLGIAANTFIGKLINGFNAILNLIQTIISVIQATSAVSGLISTILSFIPGGGVAASAIKAIPAATGGYITGPGSWTSDSIFARLSNGEFVINAKATSMYRPLLEAINGNSYSKIQKYANGGSVNRNINNNNVYIGTDNDAIKYFQTNAPRYNRYKYSKRVA